MTHLTKAYLTWDSGSGEERIDVQFNPTEISFEKGNQIAEIAIPNVNAPIQQFLYGQANKLTVELFFDTTDESADGKAKPVTEQTDKLFGLTQVLPEKHAPPMVTFHYGVKGFPGSQIPEAFGSRRKNSFDALVESVSQQFTMFSSDGVPLRARVNLTLREYIPLHRHFPDNNPQSPDRSHLHVLAADETLSDLAWQSYRQPDRWREIAKENGITDPRRIEPGSRLLAPRIS